MRLCALFSLCGLIFIPACVTTPATGRSIYENPDTVVRLEPANEVSSFNDAKHSHPVPLTKDQVEVLLTSISARTKVGLLRSFIGDPGMPRLFDKTDISLLGPPIQEALAKTNPGEAVVFYRAKNRTGTRAQVTSGILFVRDEVLVLSVANFWHSLITVSSEVGSKDRLEDVRETTSYVRDHAWVSVGEQDFAIFFDDPRYQTDRREGSLFGHPERTIAIAYMPYLTANPDPIKRAKESEEAVQQAAIQKTESQVIAELKRRLIELERANAVPTDTTRNSFVPPILTHPSSAQPPSRIDTEQDSTAKLLEIIQRLERRVAEMEKRLRTRSPKVRNE